MSYNPDRETLEKLSSLPDIKLDPQRQKEMLAMLRESESKWSGREKVHHRFAALGKGLAVCTALAGAFWLGTYWVHSDKEISLPVKPPAGSQGTPAHEKEMPIAFPSGEQDASQTLLKNMLELARQGKAINTDFGVETGMYDTLEAKWGQPDQTYYTNGLTYGSYAKHGVDLGYNKGMQITEIRSYDPRVKEVALSQVKQALGEPDRITSNTDQTVYVYNASDKYQLRVVFPAVSKQTPDPHLDHVSVLYPQGTVNLMANTNGDELVRTTAEMAKEGRVVNAEFALETSDSAPIEEKWGKPDQSDYVNGLTYAVYQKHGVVFGYNKGMQTVEIRSYDLRLQELRLSQVKKILGNPASINKAGGEAIYVYKVSPKYELKIVFPEPGAKEPDPYVNHINVIYPKGTVNHMAG
ncbi:YjgB family protein [Brevibacillus sp. B_LB10_24]|uniref:YjgB family protein n=1 Tax=Brevibacillus sp. B_LB10_24 TaxID=3380645 RepID=UPI0038B8E9AE